ncbi:cytochrome b [Bartonella sp. LJL80]
MINESRSHDNGLWDSPTRFGIGSRIFHWSMAGLFIWQFITAISHFFLSPDSSLRGFFWQTHYTVGTILFVLVLLRGIWGLINLRRRPSFAQNFWGLAARLGHFALYLLMFLVPFFALLRAYGSGRGFSVLGLQIFLPTGNQAPELMAAGNKFHGELGWLLLLLIIGHIMMVYVHRLILKDGLDKRMSRAR